MTNPEPVIATEHYRATMGHFCTGVTIVTAMAADGPAGFTCQSFHGLSIDPPTVLICPQKTSTTWPKIEAAGHFCVNVLAEDQEELCLSFAKSGAERYAGVGWTPAAATGAPLLNGVLAAIDCRLDSVLDAGDHVIVIGRILELRVNQGKPLLFYRGGFGRFDV